MIRMPMEVRRDTPAPTMPKAIVRSRRSAPVHPAWPSPTSKRVPPTVGLTGTPTPATGIQGRPPIALLRLRLVMSAIPPVEIVRRSIPEPRLPRRLGIVNAHYPGHLPPWVAMRDWGAHKHLQTVAEPPRRHPAFPWFAPMDQSNTMAMDPVVRQREPWTASASGGAGSSANGDRDRSGAGCRI